MSGTGPPRVHPLKDSQARAVEPSDSVWLSASAGTGKTQVLSARVLRLLLTPGVSPENILCLTFTKAGAAEMATRVNEVLASWVRLEPTALAAQLANIGAPIDADTRAKARTLFAHVLDCPGGGLRIDTIHAFAQWLLAAFPEEAGLVPGARPMEDRDRDLLAHQVLAGLVAQWEATGERVALDGLEGLSLRLGPDKTREWLMRCADARDTWLGTGSWQEPLRDRVAGLLGLEADCDPASVAALCDDDVFDCAALQRCLEVNQAWGTATGRKCVEAIEAFLASAAGDRLNSHEAVASALFTKDGAIRSLAALEKLDRNYPAMAEKVRECLDAVRERLTLVALVDVMTPALTVGRRFAIAWDDAKRREGLIDFDDLIHRAAGLLGTAGLGDWLRYKLDRQFDHILVDEAQDTNKGQWSIIGALTEEFFAGEGQRDGKLRTIFVVGDYKQAIFRFQGTSPRNFADAKARFAAAMAERAANDENARTLVDIGLGQSYRTAQPLLDFVDAAIETIGPDAFGLPEPPEPHIGAARPGLVKLWRPVTPRDDDDADSDDGPEQWLSGPERRMADRIALEVKSLIGRFALAKGQPRMAEPGDIMVLVRKRRELAGLIVARLHAAGIPVAGVDRLRLGAPLAVRDLLAAVRFAAQPLDDLSLANLLVSPLIGWSQDQLLGHGWRPRGRLWDHLRESGDPEVLAVREQLDPLLRRADYEPPQALLHWMLVGPWQGRRKLVARLGSEANDPIDELLNAALAFSATHTPSLTGFLQWFDAGQGELKREADSGRGLVRVMTVHGSKGLEAPIVILADATGNPDSSPPRGLTLTEDLPGGGGRTVPLIELRKDERVGRIADVAAAVAAEEREEHWRLLYVAMTRAEEALFIGGALGKREKEPAENSWYARLGPLFTGPPVTDTVWGERWELGTRAPPAISGARREEMTIPQLPEWAMRPIGPEPQPPRPLAPSAAGQDLGTDPPLAADALALAARRGVLLHRLLERLPEVPADAREPQGAAWLARQAADLDATLRGEMLTQALTVIGHPDWAELFSPDALAEVPLTATVGGQVIAGTADRLLITPDRVLVADFKTARRPPETLEQVPLATLRQMGAYAAALSAIYPGRRVEAAVLYTHAPRLIAIPAAVLAEHKPGFAASQESFTA